MRPLLALLVVALLPATAPAQPPGAKDFLRMKDLRDKVASRTVQLQEAEEFAKRPREERMLLTFARGEKKFDRLQLTGEFIVETCLLKWEEVQRDEPTEAGKRTLELLPKALGNRFAGGLEVPRKERYEASKPLLKALDSDYLHVRVAAIEALKLVYRTQNAFLYEPTMEKKDRRDPIEKWKKFIEKQKK